MKFCIHTNQLNKILEIAGAAISQRGKLPILQTVRIEAAKGSELVFATGTDLDVWCTAHKPALNVVEAGTFCVSYSKLHSISRDIKATLYFESAENKQVKITVVEEGRKQIEYLLNTYEADEFPRVPEHVVKHGILIAGDSFSKVATNALKLASIDEARIAINQLLIEADDKGVHLIATDGRQIGVFKLSSIRNEPNQFYLRRELVECLKATNIDLTGNVTVDKLESSSGSMTKLTGSYYTFIARNYDVKFPNWISVLPNESDAVTCFSVYGPSALKAVAMLANLETERPIKITFKNGELELSIPSQDNTEKASAVIMSGNLVNNPKGGISEILFNPKYLKRTFEMFPGNTKVWFQSDKHAATFSDADSMTCLMPMRT